MIRAGVAGSPAKHSLSPVLHGAWLKAADVDGVYEIFDLPRGGFAAFVAASRNALSGMNVTIPFKEEALALADVVSPRAQAAGAANVLIFRGDEIHADNTDGLGLLAAFAEQAPGWSAKAGPVVVLGAGGAARGAVAALVEAGAPEVRIVNRTADKAAAVATAVGGPVVAYAWTDLPRALNGASALINATSLGLGDTLLDIDFSGLTPRAPVMDMVYRPLKTAFLESAEAAGHPIVDGLAMLIGQAAPSFEAFYGAPAKPEANVRALALQALGQ